MNTIDRIEHRAHTVWVVATIVAVGLLLFVDPALANKFEKISGGVSGSMHIKREWLYYSLIGAGSVSLVCSILAVVVPHNNALYLNFSNWKLSALMFSLVAGLFFTAAAFV